MNRLAIVVVAAALAVFGGYSLACFQVGEWATAIVLQFGKPVRTLYEPGLYLKVPFMQNVLYFEKRLLAYDAAPRELITRDKQQLRVDNFSRWRIRDPLKFYQSVGNEGGAQSRLDDIIYSNLREVIGRTSLSEVVSGDRRQLLAEIVEQSTERASSYGIEVVDVRIKRTDLPEKNEQNVFSRMRTERERQAKRFRAEGDEEARKIRSQAERERRVLLAEAARKSELIRGEGDSLAIEIYAKAYGRDPEFFEFQRTLEAYRNTLGPDTTLVLTPATEFLAILKGE